MIVKRPQTPAVPAVCFACLLARRAPNGEGQRAQALLGYRRTAIEAVPVRVDLQPIEGFVDLADALDFHLEQCEANVILDVDLRDLDIVKPIVRIVAKRAPISSPANVFVNLVGRPTTAFFQHSFQRGVTGGVRGRIGDGCHTEKPAQDMPCT